MKYPIDLELLNALLPKLVGPFQEYKGEIWNYLNRINQAYDDGKNGVTTGYPIQLEQGMRIARTSGKMDSSNRYQIHNLLKALVDMCNEAYEQGQKDKR